MRRHVHGRVLQMFVSTCDAHADCQRMCLLVMATHVSNHTSTHTHVLCTGTPPRHGGTEAAAPSRHGPPHHRARRYTCRSAAGFDSQPRFRSAFYCHVPSDVPSDIPSNVPFQSERTKAGLDFADVLPLSDRRLMKAILDLASCVGVPPSEKRRLGFRRLFWQATEMFRRMPCQMLPACSHRTPH